MLFTRPWWSKVVVVLLESAASSLPIVATDVGGSRDVVSDDDSGYLVPARQPDQLAERMSTLMALSRSQRRAMAARARATTFESFDLERIADRWEAIYRRE